MIAGGLRAVAVALALIDVAVVDADRLDVDEHLAVGRGRVGDVVAGSRTSGPPLRSNTIARTG